MARAEIFRVQPHRLPVIGDLMPRLTVRSLPVLPSRIVSLVEARQVLPPSATYACCDSQFACVRACALEVATVCCRSPRCACECTQPHLNGLVAACASGLLQPRQGSARYFEGQGRSRCPGHQHHASLRPMGSPIRNLASSPSGAGASLLQRDRRLALSFFPFNVVAGKGESPGREIIPYYLFNDSQFVPGRRMALVQFNRTQ